MINQNKKTAVEWLVEELKKHNLLHTPYTKGVNSLVDRALEIEKDQLNQACYDGYYQEEWWDVREYYDSVYGIKKSEL